MMLTQEEVQRLFVYRDGVLINRVRRSKGSKEGQIAGGVNPTSLRWLIRVNGRLYYRSHLVWIYFRGLALPEEIDHVDGDRLNDRIENLRAATPSLNCANRKVQKRSKSGIKGVHPNGKGWMVKVGGRANRKYLGTFPTKEEAGRVYEMAAQQVYGEFARYSERES